MLHSRSGILAEAINTKILTKNHPGSLIPTPITLISTPILHIPILISPHSHPDLFFLFFTIRQYKFRIYKFTNSTMNLNSYTN